MRRLAVKSVFVVAVLFLAVVFLLPATLLLETLLPLTPEPGRRGGGDRLLPGGLVVFACFYAADRVVSFLFGRIGLSERRWSIFSRRTFG
jgi:hypothetical protein